MGLSTCKGFVMATSVSKTVTTVITERLTGKDIAELYCARNGIDPSTVSSKVLFDVPGGGDWSNTTINLDDEPVRLIITHEEVPHTT
jgi:hypothetical protein